MTAARLAVNDSQRISRALEIYRQTGRAISDYQKGEAQPDPTIVTVGLVPGDRAHLHRVIGGRFDAMVASGLLDEVAGLMKSPRFIRESPAMRCVGYPAGCGLSSRGVHEGSVSRSRQGRNAATREAPDDVAALDEGRDRF